MAFVSDRTIQTGKSNALFDSGKLPRLCKARLITLIDARKATPSHVASDLRTHHSKTIGRKRSAIATVALAGRVPHAVIEYYWQTCFDK